MKTPKARARRVSTPDQMNRLESRYSERLEIRRLAGQIVWWSFGTLRLKLADRCWYTPDFIVMLPDGTLELHETKGFMEDDAAVKLRMVAGIWFMFRLVVITRTKNGWTEREYTKPPDD